MEFKNTLIKSITAVICVAVICVTAVLGTNKVCDAKIKAASASPVAGTETAGDVVADDTATDDATVTDDTTADDTATDDATADDTATDDTTADDGAATDNTASDAGSSSSSTSTDKKPSGGSTSSKPSNSKPSSVAEIVNYYNATTKKVADKKAPFTKARTTTEKSFDAGVALKGMKSIVYKFMGVGDANKFSKTVTKDDADSYFKYFQASKLTANDVTKATCVQNGSNYTITLYIKNGSSTVKGGKVVSSNNSPLDRSGLACGDKDKDYWDHKTAENVMSAVSEVPGCGSANISESYSNAVITAVVNASTGNLVSLNAKFDFAFDLSSVMGSKGTSKASSVISMTGFKM